MVEMNRLIDFKSGMVSVIGDPSMLRPFVCEGSPFECEVFLVGSDPATEMSCNFWDFWSDDYGFDKQGWLKVYTDERKRQGERKRLSPTRNIIEYVIGAARPVRCLETNIYAKPSSNRKQYIAPFDYLLRKINPKLVVAHGKTAQGHLRYQALECELWCEDHFSYQYSKEKARALGRRIQSHFA